jgi:regulator of protease activity HflC (stomatin/prohibitin superfamily)
MTWIVLTVLLTIVGLGGLVVALGATAAGARLGGIAAVAGSIVVWAFMSFLFMAHTVDNGHVGLVKQFGPVVDTTEAGFVMVAPWKDLESISVQDETFTYVMDERQEGGSGSAVSSDSQPVYLIVQVRNRLVNDTEKLVELYRAFGGHHKERLVDPAVFNLTKEQTAGYKAINFAANRGRIRRQIEDALSTELEDHGIEVVEVTIKNVDFTDALSKAIEGTVEAQQIAAQEQAKVAQETAKAQQAIEIAKGDAQSAITRAQGEASAERVRARADADAAFLRRKNLNPLLVQWEAIQKLNPNTTLIVCPPRTICVPNSLQQAAPVPEPEQEEGQ